MNADEFLASDVTRALVETWSTLESVNGSAGNASFVLTDQKPDNLSDRYYAFVWIYVSPLVLLVGLVGNALTLCVMSRRRMRGTSTCVYLSAMAIADSLALVCRIIPEFFEACDVFVFSELNRWTCKLEKFSIYATSDAAIWILVVFTMDRLVAVCMPLLKHTVCTPRRAIFATCCVVVLAVAKNVHVFWTRDDEFNLVGEVTKKCGRPEAYRFFENEIRPWVALTLVSVVPFVIIVVSNIVIVRKLIQAHHVRHETLAVQPSLGISPITNGNGNNRRQSDIGNGHRAMVTSTSVVGRSGVFNQTSLMCLAVSLAFLICVTPSIVLTIGREQWKARPAYYMARSVSHQLSCFNHAINFFLYCFTGQRFRDELIGLMRPRRDSSSTFDEFTRQYYMTRRLTQTSTSMQLVMQSFPMSAVSISPIMEDSDNERSSTD